MKFNQFFICVWIALIILVGNVNADCETFQDDVFLSNCEGPYISECSSLYHKWSAENKCPGNTNCFIKDINVYVRTFYFGTELNPIGYVQISNGNEANCEDPSKAKYSRYLVYQVGKEIETPEFNWDCGSTQKDNACALTDKDGFDDEANCFSIKIYGDQYFLMDVYHIKYTWCWEGPRNKIIEEPVAKNEFEINITSKVSTEEKVNDKTTNPFWKYLIILLIIACIFIILRIRRKDEY